MKLSPRHVSSRAKPAPAMRGRKVCVSVNAAAPKMGQVKKVVLAYSGTSHH